MKYPLRILHLEDSPQDAELVQARLQSDGVPFEAATVASREEFIAALTKGGFDVILADYSVPGFGGMAALRLAQERCPSVPFIFVSGSIGDEQAVEVLKSGARDYVLKDRPGRLANAIKQALAEAETQESLKKTEAQLRQAQKMEAIGQLAGGVAHDFNNLLFIIMGRTELLLSRLKADDPSRRDVQLVHQAGERAAGLTRQLLAFSRRQVLQPKVLSLNTIVTDTQKLLRRLISEDITLAVSLHPELQPVKADPSQIEQVLMNLVVNARDAIAETVSSTATMPPRAPVITIETANVKLSEDYCRRHPYVKKPGHYVLMAVSDTGCGMTADVQAHMFEPFFTTKEAGKGTGLGLATVYGVVKQSGGSIEVYSEPGKGSAFKVYLPAVASAHDAVISSSLMPAVPAGNETVLLVEDEDGVRDLVREILRSHGYTVLLARHGVEALKVRQQHAGPVHLLLTDVIMPEMNGPDLAEQLGANDRKLAVLYMSGYTDHAVFNNRTIHSGAHFIQKPFTPGALARKVREVLGPAQPS